MKISYAITVYNEHTEVDNLLHHLSKHIRDEDEVVVVQDISIKKSKSIGQDDVYALEKVIEKYEYGNYFKNLTVTQFEFKKDFAALKNYAKEKCSGDYIFHLDADEIPNETLLKQLLSVGRFPFSLSLARLSHFPITSCSLDDSGRYSINF